MRTIQWELADGFPLDQGTMDFLQDEWYDRMMAFITYWQNSIGENHFIITGMEHNKDTGNISPGWCFQNNKLLYYPGGAYPGDGCVIRPVLVETEVEYVDGVDRPALKYWTATVMLGGSGEGQIYQGAKRVPKIQALTWQNLTGIPTNIVYDSNYVHTDNNFSDEDKEKLDGIEEGAEKNVQADWAQTNSSADSFIKNKPTTMMLPVVEGSVILGDPGSGNRTLTVTGDLTSAAVVQHEPRDERIIVHFPALAGKYVRIVNIKSSGDWRQDNHIVAALGTANASNFEIYVQDVFGGIQNVAIEITILQ